MRKFQNKRFSFVLARSEKRNDTVSSGGAERAKRL